MASPAGVTLGLQARRTMDMACQATTMEPIMIGRNRKIRFSDAYRYGEPELPVFLEIRFQRNIYGSWLTQFQLLFDFQTFKKHVSKNNFQEVQ